MPNHQPSHGDEFDQATGQAAAHVTQRLALIAHMLDDDPADFILAVITKILGHISDDNKRESVMLIMEKATVDSDPGWKAKFVFDYLDADPNGLMDIDQ